MNKNIIKLFAILVMIFMVGSVLVACGADGKDGANGADGKPGADGADGKDAYVCEEHDWNKQKFVISEHKYDATTGNATVGSYLIVCDDCGWAEITVEDHEFEEAVTAPTCVADGFTTLTCIDCGYTTADPDSVVAALGHDEPAFDENNISEYWTEVSNPADTTWACEYVAEYAGACMRCGDVVYDASVAAKGHTKPAFNAANPSASWTEVSVKDTCDCEYVAEYKGACADCGKPAVYDATVPAPGHSFTDWQQTLDNTGKPACETTPIEVAECDNCDDGCYKSRVAVDTTPDHVWSAWIVTESVTTTNAGKAVRTCATCANDYPDFGIQEVTLTALAKDNADYTYTKTQSSNCVNEEKGTFTHKVTGIQIKDVVVAGKSGHNITGAEYTVVKPTKVTPGAVNVKCTVCAEVITYTLPVVSNKAAYDSVEMKDYADGETPLCQDIEDTYTITFTGDGVNVKGSVVVEFDFDGDYVHSDRPAIEDCVFSPGDADDDCDYYIYKCDECGHWIVAYEVAKA